MNTENTRTGDSVASVKSITVGDGVELIPELSVRVNMGRMKLKDAKLLARLERREVTSFDAVEQIAEMMSRVVETDGFDVDDLEFDEINAILEVMSEEAKKQANPL